MSFVKDAKRLFGTANLYEILDLKNSKSKRNDFSQAEIKKAFFKLSLQFHPDRCDDKTKKLETTAKFQILSRAYAVLSDKKKKAIYDESGMIDDAEICSDDVDWVARWRMLFKKVTKEDIDKFIKKFRDSGEERDAIKESYIKHKGDMGKILDDVIGVTYEDEDRLRNMINEMIEAGELKAMRYFVAEPEKRKAKRRKAAEREAKEAEEMLREVQRKEGAKDLVALIQNRQQKNLTALDGFCDALAAKYAKKPRKAK